MSANTMNLYKMMVLYMLDKADRPITNARISDFMLTKDYASYFSLQTVLSELTESGLIASETVRNSSFFSLTGDGKKTLLLFGDNLNMTIKEDINEYLKLNRGNLIKDLVATASYKKNSNGDVLVTLRVNEYKSTLIDLSLLVPTEEKAIEICNRWEKDYEEYYGTIFNLLVMNKTPK